MTITQIQRLVSVIVSHETLSVDHARFGGQPSEAIGRALDATETLHRKEMSLSVRLCVVFAIRTAIQFRRHEASQ